MLFHQSRMVCFAQMLPKLTYQEKIILLTLTVSAVVVHFINLGLMPLMADEGIRAAVAFEMMQHKNYIVPTIWGEFYYRKPPLYNWIIIAFFKAFDSYSEFVLRLPSVIPLILLSFCTWFVSRKHIGERAGVLAAFAFMLSGRLLTRDSMLGHIDLAFSLVTFIGFFTIYHFHKRRSYWPLFLLSYALAGCGVLMKGLPSFLFQGFTLVVWFVYNRNWKQLFSLAHFAGITVFVAIVVGYFYAYSQFNSLETYFDELYGQAAMRTVVDKPWYEGLLNILTFPFENIGHLLPSSLFVVFAIRRGIFKRWMTNDFTAFVLLVLAVNIVPYWLSPGYFPRYLFMLYPLVMILLADAFFSFEGAQNWRHNFVFGVFLGAGVLVTIAPLAALFIPEMMAMDWTVLWVGLTVLLGSFICILWRKMPAHRLWWSLAFVILFRLGFDLLVLPYRYNVEMTLERDRREWAEAIHQEAGDTKVILHAKTPLYIEYAFYLGVQQDTIVARTRSKGPEYLYLVDDTRLKNFNSHSYDVRMRFHSGYRDYWINMLEVKHPE